MKKESYTQQESSDLDNTRQALQPDGERNQVSLRRALCSADNRDAVRSLTWLVSNCGDVKEAWNRIESAYLKFLSPNVKGHAAAAPPEAELAEISETPPRTDNETAADCSAPTCSASSLSGKGGDPYTMLMGIESAHKSNQLFESPLDPLAGKSLRLLSYPPHALLHYTSREGESVPPEHHLQAIRDKFPWHRDSKDQLFVPLSIILEDGREMIGLLIHRGNGSIIPQFLDSENIPSPRSHSDTYVEDRNSPNQPTRKPSKELRLGMENTTSRKADGANQGLGESSSFILQNVKGHAALAASAGFAGSIGNETLPDAPPRGGGEGLCEPPCSLVGIRHPYIASINEKSAGDIQCLCAETREVLEGVQFADSYHGYYVKLSYDGTTDKGNVEIVHRPIIIQRKNTNNNEWVDYLADRCNPS